MFLAWHRVFLNEFESRLRREVPGVTIPYWNAFKSPFPEELRKISDNEGAVIPAAQLPLPDFAETDFDVFQHDLEVGYHNQIHAVLSGTVGRRHSPRDATFWLHHAFVDRQWRHWSQKHNGAVPSTLDQWIKGDEIVTGKKVADVLHTPPLGYVYDNGVYDNLQRKGSETFTSPLEKGMILSADLGEDMHAKILILQVTSVAVFMTLQPFVHGIPVAKLGVFPPETTYVNLKAVKFGVPREEAHVRIVKKTTTQVTYIIEAVNGTRLAQFTGITDFTANGGEGATDYEMLYI